MTSINKTGNWYVPVGVALILAAIIMVLCFLMRGQTTVTGGYLEGVRSTSAKCENASMEYPFFSHNGVSSKKITINLLFSDEHLRSASLMYELRYANEADVMKSEAINHASMNKSIGAAGVNDVLSPTYSYDSTSLRMNLYALGNDFDKVKKFFLIDVSPSDVDSFRRSYESMGFTCNINN